MTGTPHHRKGQDMKDRIIAYLQQSLDEYMADRERYGSDDRVVQHRFYEMIGAKELAEVLLREPVSLQKDGKVTTGF